MKLFLEEIPGSSKSGNISLDLRDGRIVLEDWGAGKAEKLGVRKELLDGLVVLAELGAMTLVEDEDHPLVSEVLQPLLVRRQSLSCFLLVVVTVLGECEPELLNGRDDDLVRVVVGFETAYERRGVGVFLDAVLLELIELIARLAVEILAINDEQALVDVVVALKKCRSLEGSKRLARSGRVPDIAVTAVLVDAIDDRLDGVDLIRAHHQELLLACDKDHVFTDHLAERTLGEEPIGKVVEVGDPGVVLGRKSVDRKEPLVGVEGEMPRVVVGEIQRVHAVADDEELDEAEQRLGVSVTGVVLVLDDLLHRLSRADRKRLQLDLNDGNAVDQEYDVIAVMAVVRIDAELIDNLEGVFAPVFNIN